MSITAFKTPEKDGLHLCDDLTLFEFLDNNNKPVKDGETGRIVLINLRMLQRKISGQGQAPVIYLFFWMMTVSFQKNL